MMNFLKQYWYWILLILLAPIAINFILLIPVFSPIIGDDKTWLTFWGSYSSALITSAVTLFVLYRQLMQNQKENEANREINKNENERNRKLQLNILQQQQENQWLENFRQASLDYIQIYNTNDLKKIAIDMMTNPTDAYNSLKGVFDRYNRNYYKIYLLCKKDNAAIELINKFNQYFVEFENILNDIQYTVSFVKDSPDFTAFRSVLGAFPFTNTMLIYINEIQANSCNPMRLFFDLIIRRINDAMYYEKDNLTILKDYISVEQTRIDEIAME